MGREFVGGARGLFCRTAGFNKILSFSDETAGSMTLGSLTRKNSSSHESSLRCENNGFLVKAEAPLFSAAEFYFNNYTRACMGTKSYS